MAKTDMSFFKKPAEEIPAVPEPRPQPRNDRAIVASDSDISVIGPGMRVTGEVLTDGTVRIEGYVEGSVRAGKSVVICKTGEIVGDIVTQEAVIGGRLAGTLQADSRLELQSTAVIEGEIRARAQHLRLDEGARFNGQVRMLEDGAEPIRALPASAKTPAPAAKSAEEA